MNGSDSKPFQRSDIEIKVRPQQNQERNSKDWNEYIVVSEVAFFTLEAQSTKFVKSLLAARTKSVRVSWMADTGVIACCGQR